MTEGQTPAEITINVKGPSELKLQITISTDKTVADLKQAIAEKSDVPADRQRLIYSGRVLKDEDELSVYKIQSSHTIHMVKGVSRSGASPSQPVAPQPVPTMQTGQNIHDPLTQLNGHMGFGAMAGFNPFATMGLNTNDPNMMQSLLDNPQFVQQMSSVMADPNILEQIIATSPQLQAMGPQVRQIFQSDGFRQMMANPESLRWMLQMSNMMRGLNPQNAFPAPGLPSSAQNQGSDSTPAPGNSPAAPAAQPFFNPWFPPPPPPATSTPTNTTGSTPSTGATGSTGASQPQLPPFDPAMLQQMMGMFGGGSPFGGLGTPAAPAVPAAPADTTPPEERFQVQLQQLQDMGFTNASQNVRALLATGGNVNSAIEYILNGGGL